MFLTELDERARVKGSRDPLGVVPLWSFFGRKVVGNLTTVTNNVRGFTTTLLGYYFADQIVELSRAEGQTNTEIFLKFEEMAGYTRYAINGDGAIRGYRRVAARTAQSKPLMISARPEDQILSNMKIYGLSGLFTVASRSSGLLEPNETKPSEEALNLLESDTLTRMKPALRTRLVNMLSRPQFRFDLRGRDADLAEGIARMLRPELSRAEKGFYRQHLAWGGVDDPTRGLQRELAVLIENLDSTGFGFPELQKVRRGAEKNGQIDLATRLEEIETVEHLIVSAAVAFSFLQTQNNQLLSETAGKIEKHWGHGGLRIVHPEGVRALREDFLVALGDAELMDIWFRIADCLRDGAWEELVNQLISLNTTLMKKRNESAPWIEVASGRLRVRLPDEAGELPAASDLPSMWRSTYFINSLHAIVRELN